MSPTYSLLFAFSLTILPALHAEKIDSRNFAIDTHFSLVTEAGAWAPREQFEWLAGVVDLLGAARCVASTARCRLTRGAFALRLK
jgi:hypothetical protein